MGAESYLFGMGRFASIHGMFRNAISILAGVLLSGLIATSQTANAPKTVSRADADAHLLHRVEPVVPSLAKATRVGGNVVIAITIDTAGGVSSYKVISGHPMLVQAAINAVKQWKYKPFEEGGTAVPVKTEVEVSFPGGMSPSEQETREKFFPQEDQCRNLLNTGKYADAEKECRKAVEISNGLPKEVVLERSGARALLANAIFLQKRPAEAIPLYEEALELDKGYRQSDDADLASDYWNLGRAYFATGDLPKADGLYQTAVSTFEAAIQSLPSMKENYTRRLKRCLGEYAKLKEAMGQNAAAQELRKKADGLP